MENDRFHRIFQCKIKGRTITKFRSRTTGLTITHIDTEGPIVKGYFTLATEETGDDGLPHTLEHLIFLGSELYPYKGILDLAANHCLAQGTNAWTAIDHTSYTVETAGSEGFLILLPIYLDHIFFPTLSDEAFKTEVHHINGTGDDAGVVYCEMQARENNAESREEHAVQAAVFVNDCGYKWETGGIMKNLRESCSNLKVREYHKKFYRPENLDVIISGQICEKQIFNAILPIDERLAKVDYGPFTKPWTTEVELFSSYATQDIQFPAKDEDNGRVSVTWKGPQLDATMMCEAHSLLWSYLTKTSASPLVKALIDVSEAYCSSISCSSEEYPTTLITVTFKGVKPNKHQAIKEILLKTLQEVHRSPLDMTRLRNQIKNTICNFSDKLENDPSEVLASAVILDHLYGGQNNSNLQSFSSIFGFLDSLRQKDESFWKDILQYYIQEPNITINCIPSIQCMTELENAEKQRIAEQQKRLGDVGMANCEKEVNDCTEFNEKGFEEVEKLIANLPSPTIGENLSYHSINTHVEKVPGITIHEIESDFCRLFFTFDTANMTLENKTLLGLYATLFCDTALLHNGKELPYEDAIKLKEQLLLQAKCSVSGVDVESFSELVTMEFKFMMEDLQQCTGFINDLIINKIFSHDRVSTALNKMISKVGVALRKARVVLSQIDVSTRFYGSCKSSRNLFAEQTLLESFKDDIPALIKKLENLQRVLVYGNNVSLHILANKRNFTEYFPTQELDKLASLFKLSKANYPSLLPSFYQRKALKPQQLLKVVPTDESSYLFLTNPSNIPFNHPDYVAVALFAEYVGQLEGPFWKQIRGQGFAYSYSLYNSPATGSICFYLGRATNVSKAYLVAKDTVNDIIKENKLDETQIETAKGALAYNFIQKYETPYSSAFTNVINLHRDLPLSHDNDVLSKIINTCAEDLLDVCKRYYKPLFTDTANVIVCCPSTKKDEIIKDMAGIGLDINVMGDVQEYIKFLDDNETTSINSVFKFFNKG